MSDQLKTVGWGVEPSPSGYIAHMDLAGRFRAAVIRAYQAEPASAELVPTVLAKACVKLLPIAGASLSITDELRVPLGASCEAASRAERLQTTLGEGPCLTASACHQPLVADLATIEARWPMYHRQLVEQTDFRSVISFPLSSHDGRLRLGALDLYLADGEAVPHFFLDQVGAQIAEPIAIVLFEKPVTSSGRWTRLPPWLDNASVRRRMNVWVAVGILIEYANLPSTDALAALRGYAFSHDRTLDDIADDMMNQHLRAESVLA